MLQIGHQFRRGSNAELFHQAGFVCSDRFLADAQIVGDFAIAFLSPEEFKDLEFAVAETIKLGGVPPSFRSPRWRFGSSAKLWRR